MYNQAGCMCKVVALLIKPIVFLKSSLPSGMLDLKTAKACLRFELKDV